MPRTLTPSDRSSLIRLASTLPVGSGKRRAILAGLARTASFSGGEIPAESVKALNPKFLKALGVAYAKKLHPDALEIAPNNNNKQIKITVVLGEVDYEELFVAEKHPQGWLLTPEFYQFAKSRLPPHGTLSLYGDILITPN